MSPPTTPAPAVDSEEFRRILDADPGALHLKRISDALAAVRDGIKEYLDQHYYGGGCECPLCRYLDFHDEGPPSVGENLLTLWNMLWWVGSSVDQERPTLAADRREAAAGRRAWAADQRQAGPLTPAPAPDLIARG